MKNYGLHFDAQRKSAREAAYGELCAAGFVRAENGTWAGKICVNESEYRILIALPKRFPFELPKIRMDDHHKARAHIGRDGTLCLFAESGVLVDSTRPRQVVRDVIKRAEVVLSDSLAAADEVLIEEFDAYWVHQKTCPFYSLVPPNHESGAVVGFIFKGGVYLAPSIEIVEKWKAALGVKVEEDKLFGAYWQKTDRLITPPPFDKALKLGRFLEKIERATSPGAALQLRDWIRRNELPLVILISLPLDTAGGERAVLGVEIPTLKGASKKAAQRGFRPKKVPPNR